MSNKYNICFIVVYYGKFPPWFPFFLKSCGENKNIDWMFVTDIEYNETIPNNVKFLKMTIDEYKKLFFLGAMGCGVCGAFPFLAGETTTVTNMGIIYTSSPIFIILLSIIFNY